MQDLLNFAPPLISRHERSWRGITACRALRAPHGRHEFRIRQSRHVIALHLSLAPIVSADRMADRAWPKRAREVRLRVNVVPAGSEWVSDTQAQGHSEYVALYIPDEVFDTVEHGALARSALQPALDLDLPGVREILQAIAVDLRTPLYGDTLLDAAMARLAAALGRRTPGSGAMRYARLSAAQMLALDDLIGAGLDQDLGVSVLAEHLGMEAWALSRAMRRTWGLSPHRWVLLRRVEHARRLLALGSTPLAEVAAGCGFADQAHFTNAFRTLVGVTPGRWRRDAAHATGVNSGPVKAGADAPGGDGARNSAGCR